MTFRVPGGVPHHRARIEAVFEPPRMLDGWTCQLLDTATHIAGAHPGDRTSAGTEPCQPQSRRRRGAADWIEPRDSRRARSHRARRRDRFHRSHRRRIGHRQGARRAADSRAQSPAQGPLRRRQLRRDCRDAARGRALWNRGTDGDGRARSPRQVRARPRGDALSRRSVRSVAGGASQAAARHSGSRRSSASAASARAGSTRGSSWRPTARSSGLVELGRFRLRPLLPAAWRRRAGAAAAGAARGHHRARADIFWSVTDSCGTLQLSTAAADALLAYDWPGNVRELERVIERAVALAGSRLARARRSAAGAARRLLPMCSCPRCVRARSMRAWGSRYARLVYERCGNNKRQACRELGISYHTLRAYLRFRPERCGPADMKNTQT